MKDIFKWGLVAIGGYIIYRKIFPEPSASLPPGLAPTTPAGSEGVTTGGQPTTTVQGVQGPSYPRPTEAEIRQSAGDAMQDRMTPDVISYYYTARTGVSIPSNVFDAAFGTIGSETRSALYTLQEFYDRLIGSGFGLRGLGGLGNLGLGMRLTSTARPSGVERMRKFL